MFSLAEESEVFARRKTMHSRLIQHPPKICICLLRIAILVILLIGMNIPITKIAMRSTLIQHHLNPPTKYTTTPCYFGDTTPVSKSGPQYVFMLYLMYSIQNRVMSIGPTY